MKPEFERFEYTGTVLDHGSSLSLNFSYDNWFAFLSLGLEKGYYGHWFNGTYSGNLTRDEANLLLQKLR